jgi:Fe-S-cluster formation regulator IscX/YfhJ
MSKKIENENIKVIPTLDRKIVEFEGFRKRICKLKEVDRISTIHCAQ